MPYEKKEAVLNKLLEDALQTEEIAKAIRETDAPDAFVKNQLKEHIKQKSGEIWDAGAKEIKRVNDLILTLERLERDIENTRLELATFNKRVRRISQTAIVFVLLIATAFVVPGFIFGWTTLLHWIISNLLVVITSITSIITPLVALFAFFWNRSRGKAIKTGLNNGSKLVEEINDLEGQQEDAKNKTIESIKKVEQAVLMNGIIPELRLKIDLFRQPSYDVVLPLLSTPGLGEVFDASYEIPTNSKSRLLRMLESMPGGSIGIAGPRGSGKSMLLHSVCLTSKIQEKEVVSVLAPAPVEYNARDFILYIFSEVCTQILQHNQVEVKTPWESMKELQKASFKQNAGTYLFSLWGSGGILISLFIILALSIALITASVYIAHTTFPASPTPSLSITISDPSSIGTPIVIANTTGENQNSSTPDYLSTLGISAAALLPWGIFLFVVSFIGLAVSLRSRLDRRRQRRKELQQRRLQAYSDDPIVTSIIALARKWLEALRFQQSYSSGWSGTLSLPIALQGAVNSAVTLAQSQLSLPEIVDGYHDFMERITEKYIVIIAIDEMDKLESDEKAQQFLNEIKSLFGIKNCFYLVSVSESAMSSFERRGLPFRDAFDSSFDDIIHVDYLQLASAERLLKRRVIGIPIPFLCLCYCFSGGLARDLIRICRNMFERARFEPTKNTLAELCNFLIMEDIRAKLRAVSVVASKESSIQPAEITQFFDVLHKVEAELKNALLSLNGFAILLNDTHQEVTVVVQPARAQVTDSNDIVAGRELVKSLKMELGTYLYYAATLLEFFSNKTDVTEWQQIEQSDYCDQLAQVHQFFSISPYVACTMISSIRQNLNMECLE